MADEPEVSAKARGWIEAMTGSAVPAKPAAVPANEADERAIDSWRQRIDEADNQLMRLLNSRAACALEIGRVKQRAGLPIYSPEREAQIFARLARDNPGPLDRAAVRRVFERIIDESRRLERLGSSSAEQAADAAAEGRERRD